MASEMQAKAVLEDTVVSSDLPVDLTSTKPPSGRSRSIRKRKFESISEMQKDQEFQQKTKRSKTIGLEGPFWFEEGSVEINEDHEKIQHGITNRELQLLKEIVKSGFFTEQRLAHVVVPLNDETSKSPRLRAFDWAVTNFAKGKPQLLQEEGTASIVDPNLDYQNELKRYHRLLFDPFRRGTHIFFEVPDETESERKKTHRTTVGQLSFIKWCLEHGVDKYVAENLDHIREHMHSMSKAKPKDRMRRRELTKAPRRLVRGCVHGNLDVTL